MSRGTFRFRACGSSVRANNPFRPFSAMRNAAIALRISMVSTTSRADSPRVEQLIRFEIREGSRRLSFAVTDEALETASGLNSPSTSIMRQRSFDRFRVLINAAANRKLSRLPPGSIDPIILTSADLRCVAPERGEPAFGSPARERDRRLPCVGSVARASTTSD